jgi:dihydrofolate reductase
LYPVERRAIRTAEHLMGKLIYIATTSLDGFMSDLSDPDVPLDWHTPSAEFYSAILDIQRSVGTYLYGRRMFETMAVWGTAHLEPGAPPFTPGLGDYERAFAEQWRAADKVVFSTTLAAVAQPRTRIERSVDPDAIRRLVASSDRDFTVGGPHLASAMLAANLVDELHAFVFPAIIGAGLPWLPRDHYQRLELAGARALGGGIVHLHYKASP